jgi:acetate kinase
MEVDGLKTALVFNSGSATLKFGYYRLGPSPELLFHGAAELAASLSSPAKPVFWTSDNVSERKQFHDVAVQSQEALVQHVVALLPDNAPIPDIIAHRVVHGGPHVRSHCLVDSHILQHLAAASDYAPLHNKPALAVITAAQNIFPRVPQAACLDTAFHAGLPEIAKVLPLTRELQFEGVERYGFHGLSCESVVHQLREQLPPRLVIAHLGHGASITAVSKGRSVDTSMGLTPAGGIPMSTRSGDLDPGVLIYLLREKRYGAARLEQMLNQRSGLLSISRLSDDMRVLRKESGSNADAALAIDMFCQGVRKQIAAMAAVLEGIDQLVFTGGIGEHDACTRAQVCQGLAWLGLGQDSARVLALPAQEEAQMARHAFSLLKASAV